MQFTLISKTDEISDIKTFIFKPDTPTTWVAGQYFIYKLSQKNEDLRGKIRFFTNSSSPFEKNPSITTRINNKSSSFKKKLDKLSIGDKIEVKGPDGDFVIDDPTKNYIFIAGGIGITPFRSIIKDLDHNKLPINITLLYANRNHRIVFKQELDEINKRHSEFKIYYFISPKEINEEILTEYASDKKNTFFVSGPDPMVESIVNILTLLNVLKENIKEDYFSGYDKF